LSVIAPPLLFLWWEFYAKDSFSQLRSARVSATPERIVERLQQLSGEAR
jgi:hypothetical protein